MKMNVINHKLNQDNIVHGYQIIVNKDYVIIIQIKFIII